MSHIEVSPKSFQIRFYNEKGDYSSSMQMHVEGDRGVIHSLAGAGFYEIMQLHIPEILERTGTKVWHASLQDWHVDVMRKKLGHILDIQVVDQGEISGYAMKWVEMRLK